MVGWYLLHRIKNIVDYLKKEKDNIVDVVSSIIGQLNLITAKLNYIGTFGTITLSVGTTTDYYDIDITSNRVINIRGRNVPSTTVVHILESAVPHNDPDFSDVSKEIATFDGSTLTGGNFVLGSKIIGSKYVVVYGEDTNDGSFDIEVYTK